MLSPLLGPRLRVFQRARLISRRYVKYRWVGETPLLDELLG